MNHIDRMREALELLDQLTALIDDIPLGERRHNRVDDALGRVRVNVERALRSAEEELLETTQWKPRAR